MVNGLLIAIIVIFAWIILLLILSPFIKKSKRISLLGPLLMIKAIKRRGILDRVAEKFPAIGFSRFSVALVLATGIFAIFFLFYGAYLSTTLTVRASTPLTYYLGIPGVNPIIPVTYGIPAFAISVVIHEVFHGIVARKHGLKVNSVGILFFVVPMGAFVEPDEEEITKSDPVVRRRIFGAGAGINIVLGIAMVLILSAVMMPAAQPIHQGVYIQGVSSDQPYQSLIHPGEELIAYGNYSGLALNNMFTNSNITPGKLVPMEVFNGTSVRTIQYPSGVNILSTLQDFPASQVGIKTGSIIYSINGSIVYNQNGMENTLDNITPGTTVHIVTVSYNESSQGFVKTVDNFNLTTVTKYSYYSQFDPTANKDVYKNQSFIGVTSSYLGLTGVSLSDIKPVIFLSSIFTDPWYGFLSSISLPLSGFSPVPHHLTQLFHTPFNAGLFWGTVNMLFWLYWVNILLGVTNALPLLILDGNQFFKDTFLIAGRRKSLSFLSKESVLNRIMGVLNIVVIFLLLWEIIVPRII